MLVQLISVTGAVLVLLGFAGLQTKRLDRDDTSFNLLNLIGSLLLAWVAIHDRRWGFIGLEVIWAGFSIPPLLRKRAGNG